MDWWTRGAEAGGECAMRELGVRLLEGRGVLRDELRGAAQLRCAADAGDPEAMEALAACFSKGAWRGGCGGSRGGSSAAVWPGGPCVLAESAKAW